MAAGPIRRDARVPRIPPALRRRGIRARELGRLHAGRPARAADDGQACSAGRRPSQARGALLLRDHLGARRYRDAHAGAGELDALRGHRAAAGFADRPRSATDLPGAHRVGGRQEVAEENDRQDLRHGPRRVQHSRGPTAPGRSAVPTTSPSTRPANRAWCGWPAWPAPSD